MWRMTQVVPKGGFGQLTFERRQHYLWASLMAQMVENPSSMQETQIQSLDWKGPRKGNGNPLQHSCLENPLDRGYMQRVGHN